MKWSAIAREAWLNIITGTARVAILGLVAAALTAVVLVTDLRTVRAIDQSARAYQSSGASILMLSAQGGVDPDLCERLSSQPGVRAAGAIRRVADSVFAAAPQTSVPTFEVTPGFPAILSPKVNLSTPGGIVLSQQAADVVGAHPGDVIATTPGMTRVAGVYQYPQDGRALGYGYAMLVPTHTPGPFDACWVDQWPQSASMSRLIRGVVTPGQAQNLANQITVSQLNTTLGTSLDAHDQLVHRITRWAPIEMFFAGLLLALVAVRLRRLEFAAALHARVRKGDLLSIAELETVAWVVPVFLVGAAISTGFAVTGTRDDVWRLVALGMLTPLATISGALLGTALGVLLLQENQLFRYFKER